MRIALFGAGRAGKIKMCKIASHPPAELGYIFDVDQAAAQTEMPTPPLYRKEWNDD